MAALVPVDWFLDGCTAFVQHVPVVFRSSGIVILFALGWGWNVWGLDRFNVPFRRVLGAPRDHIGHRGIFAAVRVLATILIACFMLHEICARLKLPWGQSLALVLFWLCTGAYFLLSQQATFREAREFGLARCRNVAGSTVVFADVLAADALTSMSKLLVDLQQVVCALLTLFGLSGVVCHTSLVGPALASLPYALRAWQCFLVYRQTGAKLQLVNLGKYFSSFPVIWLSVMRHRQLSAVDGFVLDQHDQRLEMLWLYSLMLNTLYSFLWDVTMDWGLSIQPQSQYPLLRSTLLFGNPLYYYAAIVGDLALRLCWSLKLSSHIQRHATGKALVFLFEVLEVFRRIVWNFFRVEWECVKTQEPPALPDKPLPQQSEVP